MTVSTQKLQKVLAERGLGSRREMEEWIKAGRVSVNGKPAEIGMRVAPQDRITVDRRPLRGRSTQKLPRVLLYHKPQGEIVSRDDLEGRPSVFDHLPPLKNEKWLAAGRLDFMSSGLLIFTTDGEMANRLMHPRFQVEREYAVRVRGQLTPEQMHKLTRGLALDDGQARFQSVAEAGGEGSNRWYHVVTREGRNRFVRRMFESIGLEVSRLIRVRFGEIQLPPRLKRGNWMELPDHEVTPLLARKNWAVSTPAKSRAKTSIRHKTKKAY
ncbi:MAG: pseudouridine synthase [Burkholderiales bacterium]